MSTLLPIVIDTHGAVRSLYHDAVSLSALGQRTIVRVSHVEPDQQGCWWADLAPVAGPKLGPFSRRSAALAAEAAWLETNRLS